MDLYSFEKIKSKYSKKKKKYRHFNDVKDCTTKSVFVIPTI